MASPLIVQTPYGEDVDVTVVRCDSKTGLHAAAGTRDNAAVVNMLVENGADVNAIDLGGKTVLHAAARTENNAAVVELLVQNGADVKAID
eukprot:contig_2927_g601